MRAKLFLFILIMSSTLAFSQNNSLWKRQAISPIKIKQGKEMLPTNKVFSLDIETLKRSLLSAPERGAYGKSNLIISFPNADGKLEKFRIMEASVMDAQLQARYPEIRSYAGQGINDPSARIRFSISPNGFQSMVLSAITEASFIESITEDNNSYAVFTRAERINATDDFECTTFQTINRRFNGSVAYRNADDSTLRTYRLAMSATGEYTAYHGGTKASALAAINATMTRVNGVFESDFNMTTVLIANTDNVIYTNASTDPYTGNFNSEVQSTLTSVIGESNYDIGHLVHKGSNNGNAGCIGCVCTNGSKGSGFTSYGTPQGDNFDIDYVAHEMGHQFGANHTFSFRDESTNAHFEPGSGTTIMGYAGITGATDVQTHSDPYFHWYSIQQVTDYIKTTSCQTNTNTGNAVPTANAGADYTIPKGTAFVLTGTGTDANAGDVLTYCWEQSDENNAATTYPSTTATTGVAFRSYNPTTDTKRYFPRLSTIKTGATSWQWEAVPNVARTLNFRMTVRDNRAGGANNNSDDMIVTVKSGAGPFIVNTPNTNVTWSAGSTQAVTWDVAGTTGNGINAANVDIFLSTDGGNTYPITLASNVPNDGSHNIVVPNNQGTQSRVMVRGANNIFFDISNANFTISGTVTCNATTPTGLAASSVGASTATLSWNAVSGATYDLRYRKTGTTTWTTTAVAGVSTNLSGLSVSTQYETQVRSKCSGGANSAYTTSVNFTTTAVQLNYCASQGNSVADEYIQKVQIGTINNTSGSGGGYSDHTSISTDLTKGASATVTITPKWTGTVYSEGYSVWIDYNQDGDFTDAGEQVWTKAASKTTPVSGTFTVPIGAATGNTRMRVSMKYNGIPTSCEAFSYGEVEDYTVNLVAGVTDTTAPVITLTGAATVNLTVGDTYTEQGATATDNVDGNLTSSIVTGGDTVNTAVAGTYVVTYNVSDAAGNAATQVTRTVNVATPPDTTAPVITLTGAATVNLTVGDTYTEQGATATDNVDGNLTSSIVTGGDTVNTAVAGTYVVTYNVSDAAGNAATQVIRTVNVSPVSSGGCTGGIASYPYNESFENTLGAWSQANGDNFDWTLKSGTTPSSNTGPSAANDGTYYIYMESSSPNFSTKRAILNSPCFDLSGETQATVSFMYHMYGASTMGSLALEASTDNGNTWTSIWSKVGNQGNSWKAASIDLAAYVGATVQLRFNGITGTTWQGDMAVDKFSISGGGSTGGCVATTLSITFDQYPEETSWDIKDNSGTVVASGGTYDSQADNSTLTIANCLPAGCYTFTMKDVYGDGMCCTYGNGSFSLKQDSDNTILASGGTFTSTSTTNFCVGTGRFVSNEEKITLENEVMLYPNPAKDVISISLRDQKMTQYMVTNMMGQTVLKGNVSEKDIRISNLKDGVYFIEFSSNKKRIVKRFVKK